MATVDVSPDLPPSMPQIQPTADLLLEEAATQQVQLFSDNEDPSVWWLRILSSDHPGLLFKVCDLLTTHGIDIASASITTGGVIIMNQFELHTARPWDVSDVQDICNELKEFLEKGASGDALPEATQNAISKRLPVNPDLLSVVSFEAKADHTGPASEMRYSLEIAGINQAGLLTYAALVLFRAGFTIVNAKITTIEGQISDTFEVSTTSPEAEHLLRSYLVVPVLSNTESPYPFHATPSDHDLLKHMWAPGVVSPMSPSNSCSLLCSPPRSREGSLDSLAEVASDTCQSRIQVEQVAPKKLSRLTSVAYEKNIPLPISSPTSSASGNRKRELRRMSVRFTNGDLYSGSCVGCENGEKRHGFGTYTYSPDTHCSYKQYRGQWREDKKHGYGALFHRDGGVYVGQWENNKKHGLGVFLDSANEQDATSMPTFKYEGEWYEDEPHGLGAEESEASSYFGCFVRGKQHGRGLRMSISKSGFMGCEVVDGDSVRPLSEAMEAMEGQFSPTMSPASSSTACPTRGRSSQAFRTSDVQTHRDSRSRILPVSEDESGSSGKTSGDTRTPKSPRLQNMDGTSTPVSVPGNRSMKIKMSSPLASALRASRKNSSDSGMVEGDNDQSSSGGSNPDSMRPSRSSNPNVGQLEEIQRRQASEPLEDTCEKGTPVVFSMWEENNLLSPGQTNHEFSPSGNAFMADNAEWQCRHSALTASLDLASTEPELREGEDKRTEGGVIRSKSEGRPRRAREFVRSPTLWSEEELAYFLAFVGIGKEVCQRVRKAKLKGVTAFLEMSNSEMRREFGLMTPVERLVIRRALKRFLEADRWENSLRGHKVGDMASDSVLAKYMIPFEEIALVAKISQGGYGTVYRGVLEPTADRGHLQANRSHLVAVKEMKGERKVRMYELLKEACVMAPLRHPNICSFIGVCTDENARKYFIISDLMDCSLFDLIHQPFKLRWQGEVTVQLVVCLAGGISAGVAYIHSLHLVHADLKSSNILIDYTSSWEITPRICDFGHAAVRTSPAPHHRCGTPHWAAPEVLRSEALGPAADVYSVGVIIWEMLAQRLPHKGLSFGQVLASVGWAGWTPDMALLPKLPADLRKLLKQCLSFTPSERPSSKDLQRHLLRVPQRQRLKALKILAGFLGLGSI